MVLPAMQHMRVRFPHGGNFGFSVIRYDFILPITTFFIATNYS